MRKLIITMIVCTTLLINFGCNENSTQVIHAQSDYIMPLAVGNMWVGRVQKIDTNGNIISVYNDTLLIIKDTTINGVLWYMGNDNEALFRNSDWGLISGYTTISDWEQPFFKYPFTVGQQWVLDTMEIEDANTGELDTVIYGVEAASIDTSITVPHGTYECHYYKPYTKKLDGSSSNKEIQFAGWHWYSPNYGPIKFIFYDLSDQTGNTKEVWELIYRELY